MNIDVKLMSPQRVVVGGILDFEFVGDGCLLPIEVKRALVADIVASAERHINMGEGPAVGVGEGD